VTTGLLIVAWCLQALHSANGWQGEIAETPHPGSSVQQPTEAARRGHDQFLKTCAFCHGPDANGGSSGPNLLRSAVVRHDENGNLIGPLIREGRPDKGMPAMQLTSGQILDVIAFLRFRLAQSDRRSPRRPGADYSAAKVLVGNAAAGKAFFNGAGGCAACHSPAGDLAGIARKYSPVDLQARLLYPPDQLPAVSVTDSHGKEYKGKLRHLTNYDVAIEGSDGWYRSWPLRAVKVQIRDNLDAHRQLLSIYTDTDMHNVFSYLETLK
jgi:cytochrome c oxidase cbb3-type subunit 3